MIGQYILVNKYWHTTASTCDYIIWNKLSMNGCRLYLGTLYGILWNKITDWPKRLHLKGKKNIMKYIVSFQYELHVISKGISAIKWNFVSD